MGVSIFGSGVKLIIFALQADYLHNIIATLRFRNVVTVFVFRP
jgi:hypothetical protein